MLKDFLRELSSLQNGSIGRLAQCEFRIGEAGPAGPLGGGNLVSYIHSSNIPLESYRKKNDSIVQHVQQSCCKFNQAHLELLLLEDTKVWDERKPRPKVDTDEVLEIIRKNGDYWYENCTDFEWYIFLAVMDTRTFTRQVCRTMWAELVLPTQNDALLYKLKKP